MAVDAFFRLGHHGRVIPLAVEFAGKCQNFFGAELDAVSAPLASIGDDMHDPPGDFHGAVVERLPPVFHKAFSDQTFSPPPAKNRTPGRHVRAQKAPDRDQRDGECKKSKNNVNVKP